MTYVIEFLPAARKQFEKLTPKARQQVAAMIDRLSDNPRPHGCKALHGPLKGYLRIDSGNYRVIYEIHDKRLMVIVVKIGDRKDIYR